MLNDTVNTKTRVHGRLVATIIPQEDLVGIDTGSAVFMCKIEQDFFAMEELWVDGFEKRHHNDGTLLRYQPGGPEINLSQEEYTWLERFLMQYRRGLLS